MIERKKTMELRCDKGYLILPASFNARKKRLLFYLEDTLVFDLVVQLDYFEPEFLFPVDIRRFKGKTLRVECDRDIALRLETTDDPGLDHSGKYRPLAHFTSQRGWINDPNGLTYHNGRYLMCYQHNPAATTWENMHWGSAESEDLVHWQERGDVLFPDQDGTVFSGSGIVDSRNVSELKQGEEDIILYFYTCAGNFSEASKGKPFTQRLAYSPDGGKTLIKYPKPLLEHIVGENRDPKVIYYETEKCYIMALYLDGHEFGLFRSENIFDWEELQRITLPDDAECPDLYPLSVGEAGIKWIFSGASDRYYIGSFDGRRFTPESEELRLNWGDRSYAAQSWSGLPGGRIVRTAFINTVIPGQPFGCCMDIPQEMTLRTVNGARRLCAWPVDEIKKLYTDTKRFENIAVSETAPFKYKVGSKACDIILTAGCTSDLRFSLFGLDIEYLAEKELLRCGECEAPVSGEGGLLTLRVIYDTLSAEIYADSGSVFMGIANIQDSTLDTLLLTGSAVIKQLLISGLGPFF